MIPILEFIILYLIWAFVSLEIDFRNWTDMFRGILVFSWIVIAVLTIRVMAELKQR